MLDLKQTYCPVILIPSQNQCESNTLNALPPRFQKILLGILKETFTTNGLAEINHSLDGGFKKVLNILSFLKKNRLRQLVF